MSNDTNGTIKGSRSRQANQTYDQTSAEETKRFIVLFRDAESGINQLQTTAGLQVVSNIGGDDVLEQASEGIVDLRSISAAIVSADPDRIEAVKKKVGKRKAISIIVPDCRMRPTTSYSPEQLEGYLKGYRDAVVHLTDMLMEKPCGSVMPLDTLNRGRLQQPCTWGLNATRVSQSRYSGRDIRVAVLDTGFDKLHPDFGGRSVVARSFLNDNNPADLQGHGTHCIGTAMGPKSPSNTAVPRYGCAFEAEIYAGKVVHGDGHDNFSEGGYAWMSNVLSGIEWAIDNKCRIINLSLGWPLKKDDPYSDNYLQLFRKTSERALNAGPGTLIVAATGNKGASQAELPAYCEEILAVGAIDNNLQTASFSNHGADVMAPGIQILSSVPRNIGGYHNLTGYDDHFSGTSMAAAHVSGIAALWAEALGTRQNEPATAEEIWDALLDSAKGGIVQAP